MLLHFFANERSREGIRGHIKRGRKPFLESSSYLAFAVGVRGFEPPTTTTPLWCATGLRYTPLSERDKYSRNFAYPSRLFLLLLIISSRHLTCDDPTRSLQQASQRSALV